MKENIADHSEKKFKIRDKLYPCYIPYKMPCVDESVKQINQPSYRVLWFSIHPLYCTDICTSVHCQLFHFVKIWPALLSLCGFSFLLIRSVFLRHPLSINVFINTLFLCPEREIFHIVTNTDSEVRFHHLIFTFSLSWNLCNLHVYFFLKIEFQV